MEENNVVSSAPQKVNRTWIIISVVIVFLCCCLVAAAAVGYILIVGRTFNSVSEDGGIYSGLADEQLKTDTLNTIKQYESSQSGCNDVSLFLGAVITSPALTGDGSWEEEWSVNVCGDSHLYSIVFTPAAGGGTDFSIERIDQ
jgi:anaerobic C4-dicarboxylate transporter